MTISLFLSRSVILRGSELWGRQPGDMLGQLVKIWSAGGSIFISGDLLIIVVLHCMHIECE